MFAKHSIITSHLKKSFSTLFQRLGEDAKLKEVCTIAYQKIYKDPTLIPFFS